MLHDRSCISLGLVQDAALKSNLIHQKHREGLYPSYEAQDGPRSF